VYVPQLPVNASQDQGVFSMSYMSYMSYRARNPGKHHPDGPSLPPGGEALGLSWPECMA
jgi:hypothetical protein